MENVKILSRGSQLNLDLFLFGIYSIFLFKNRYDINVYLTRYVMSQKTIVLSYLQTLPSDRVTTYKALAERFNTHPRAIATYMRTNKELDTFPCYKVVANDRWLNWYVLGIEEKQRRLENDWVMIEEWKVKEEYILRTL